MGARPLKDPGGEGLELPVRDGYFDCSGARNETRGNSRWRAVTCVRLGRKRPSPTPVRDGVPASGVQSGRGNGGPDTRTIASGRDEPAIESGSHCPSKGLLTAVGHCKISRWAYTQDAACQAITAFAAAIGHARSVLSGSKLEAVNCVWMAGGV
jgi:hypothetical protein